MDTPNKPYTSLTRVEIYFATGLLFIILNFILYIFATDNNLYLKIYDLMIYGTVLFAFFGVSALDENHEIRNGLFLGVFLFLLWEILTAGLLLILLGLVSGEIQNLFILFPIYCTLGLLGGFFAKIVKWQSNPLANFTYRRIMLILFAVILLGLFTFISIERKYALGLKNPACANLKLQVPSPGLTTSVLESKVKGYEAVARKDVKENKTTLDIITNFFPDSETGVYTAWLFSQAGGRLCALSHLGNLKKNELGIYRLAVNFDERVSDDYYIGISKKDTVKTVTDFILLGSFGRIGTPPSDIGEKPIPVKPTKDLENLALISYPLSNSKHGYRLMDGEKAIKEFGEYVDGSLSNSKGFVVLLSLEELVLYDAKGIELTRKTFNYQIKGVTTPSWSADDRYLVFGTSGPGNDDRSFWIFDKKESKLTNILGTSGILTPMIFSPVEYKFLTLNTYSKEDKVYLSVSKRDSPVTKYSSGCPWVCGDTSYKLSISSAEAARVRYKWSDEGLILLKLPNEKDYSELSSRDDIDIKSTSFCGTTKEYTDLTEALKNPEKVCVLSLTEPGLSEFPSEIKSFVNLQELNLTGGKITKLPREIGNYTNLKLLNLSGNDLTDLPPEFTNLTNLVDLGLSFNGLTQLPQDIYKLKNLKTLYLDGNNISQEELSRIKQALPNTRVSH